MSQHTINKLVVGVADFDAGLTRFTRDAGFRIDRISPADSPAEADLSNGALAIVLRRDPAAPESTLALDAADLDPNAANQPPGVTIEATPATRGVVLPPVDQALVVSRIADSDDFSAGRAGMGYRDLIPGRLGGRFIASHIRIAEGGDVPDYAHFHKIRFQMIFCYKGWVRVVYEDQGEPFVMNPGDCVLQPPEIRHRVLESSPGLEVVEIGCPAEHDTYADHDIGLPTGVIESTRDFGGQQFVRHVATEARWEPWRLPGFVCRDIGIGAATDGLAGVRVLRPDADGARGPEVTHDAEFVFFFVLTGSLRLVADGRAFGLMAGDSVVVPAGMAHQLGADAGAEVLEVTLPAAVPFT